MKATITRVYKE